MENSCLGSGLGGFILVNSSPECASSSHVFWTFHQFKGKSSFCHWCETMTCRFHQTEYRPILLNHLGVARLPYRHKSDVLAAYLRSIHDQEINSWAVNFENCPIGIYSAPRPSYHGIFTNHLWQAKPYIEVFRNRSSHRWFLWGATAVWYVTKQILIFFCKIKRPEIVSELFIIMEACPNWFRANAYFS